MTYFVFSDSHRYSENMLAVLKHQLPDELIFLGDGELDLLPVRKKYTDLPIHQVRGNCDIMSSAKETLIIKSGRKKIFACHGHTLGVKYSLDTLINTAYAAEVDVVLFGHTHIPYSGHTLAMDLLNPGAIGECPDPTYGKITIDGFNVNCKIIHLNSQ